jgi:hypothetical protein
MTKFFFHIRDDSRLVEDGRGLDLPDLASALAEARRAAREIRSRFPDSSGALDNKEFEICDAAGRELAVLPLVARRPPPRPASAAQPARSRIANWATGFPSSYHLT